MPSASSISVGLRPALTSSSMSRRGLHGEALGKLQALAPRQRQRCGRPVSHVGKAGECKVLARDRVGLAHAAGLPQNSAPAATFSSTVIFGNGCTIWNVRARPSRAIW